MQAGNCSFYSGWWYTSLQLGSCDWENRKERAMGGNQPLLYSQHWARCLDSGQCPRNAQGLKVSKNNWPLFALLIFEPQTSPLELLDLAYPQPIDTCESLAFFPLLLLSFLLFFPSFLSLFPLTPVFFFFFKRSAREVYHSDCRE